MEFSAVILAAGKGTRMKSKYSKLVHRVAGKAIIEHVVAAVQAAGISKITLVLGHGREEIEALFSGAAGISFAVQAEQLGTGHALLQAVEYFTDQEKILVLAGDTPMLQASTLQKFMDDYATNAETAGVLSTRVVDAYGYGRIVRDEAGDFMRIVEEKDADGTIKAIDEINSGIYCFNAAEAFAALRNLSNDNAQQEYYLTDILEMLREQGRKVQCFCISAEEDIYGINDRRQLAQAEQILRRRVNDRLMLSGVTLIDPASTWVDVGVKIGRDTIIYPNTIVEGHSCVGEDCEIGPNTHITDCSIGDAVRIESSRLWQAELGDACTIGPYAYLRPGTRLGSKVKVGDFVEIKKSLIGDGSKIPHLSYIGDATIGSSVNIGAGTITCNYDGHNKFETILEDGVFIGSNCNLVAPVRIGNHAVTGAGSTITRDVPAGSLGLERADQKNIEHWQEKKS